MFFFNSFSHFRLISIGLDIMWPEEEDDQYISEDAMDLINQLLAFQPQDRLGHNGFFFVFFINILIKVVFNLKGKNRRRRS
jgi:hypothetical protein